MAIKVTIRPLRVKLNYTALVPGYFRRKLIDSPPSTGVFWACFRNGKKDPSVACVARYVGPYKTPEQAVKKHIQERDTKY